jgi:hypothetical protein
MTIEVQAIEAAVKNAHGDWKLEENFLTAMSREERARQSMWHHDLKGGEFFGRRLEWSNG